MRNKSIYFFILIGSWVATVALYLWFAETAYFESFNIWTRHNLVLFYIILFLAKVLAIVWPPLPGSLFTLGAIPFIGWFEAFFIDFAGSMAGASIAYFLGRNYGYAFLNMLFSHELVEKIRQTKIKPNREIESIFITRLAGGGNAMELVCYGAGVLNIRFRNFFIASFLVTLFGLPIYYLGGNLFTGGNILAGIAFSAITLFVFWKIKGRYIE